MNWEGNVRKMGSHVDESGRVSYAFRGSDILVPKDGGAELEVASLVNDTTVRTTTDVPENLKPRGTLVRRGPPERQYRADATYTPVRGEDGTVSLVWPNPARDRSDVWIQRTWSAAAAYRLSHKTQSENLLSRLLVQPSLGT